MIRKAIRFEKTDIVTYHFDFTVTAQDYFPKNLPPPIFFVAAVLPFCQKIEPSPLFTIYTSPLVPCLFAPSALPGQEYEWDAGPIPG